MDVKLTPKSLYKLIDDKTHQTSRPTDAYSLPPCHFACQCPFLTFPHHSSTNSPFHTPFSHNTTFPNPASPHTTSPRHPTPTAPIVATFANWSLDAREARELSPAFLSCASYIWSRARERKDSFPAPVSKPIPQILNLSPDLSRSSIFKSIPHIRVSSSI